MSRTVPKKGWLALLCVTRMFQATVATVWAGVLPGVMVDWNLSASGAGLVQSAWHVGYLISLFSVGFVSDRIGPRRVFLTSSALTALAALAFGLGAQDPVSAAALYGFTGLCAGGCYSPGLQLLSANALPSERGKAMGAFIGAASMGYGLSLLTVAALADTLPWRSILLIIAGMVALGAVLTIWALARMQPDFIRSNRAPPFSITSAVVDAVRNKPAMAGNWAYAAHCWELMALWAWLPAYLAYAASTGGTSAEMGIAFAAVAHLVSVAGSMLGGAASDRFGRVRVMLLASCASLVCSFTFGWLSAAPLVLLTIFGAIYNMVAIADSSVYSTALAEVVPPERLGAAYSVRSVMGFGAGAISPWIFGLALDWGQKHANLPGSPWVWAWSTAGLGATLGPAMILKYQRLVQARR